MKRPFLDKLIFQYLPSQTTTFSHFIAEKIDMMFLLHPEDYGALQRIPSVRVYQNWYPLLYIIGLNVRHPLFQDSRVRRALNLAINQASLVDRVLKGKGKPAGGTEPWVEEHAYHPREALDLLRQAGWEDSNQDFILDREGKNFEFTVLDWQGDDLSMKTLQLVQSQLQALGIRMNIKVVPLGDYVESVWTRGDFEAGFMNFTYRFHHINDFITWHSGSLGKGTNFTGYANARVDELLDTARSSLDAEASRKALIDLQQALHDDPPGVFLFWREMSIAVHNKFRGVPEKRMESFRDLVRVWVPQELQ